MKKISDECLLDLMEGQCTSPWHISEAIKTQTILR